MTVAAALDAEDLKDLGIAVGLRASVLRAIAESQHFQAGEVQLKLWADHRFPTKAGLPNLRPAQKPRIVSFNWRMAFSRAMTVLTEDGCLVCVCLTAGSINLRYVSDITLGKGGKCLEIVSAGKPHRLFGSNLELKVWQFGMTELTLLSHETFQGKRSS